jgi:hypothetical protein
VCREEQHNLIRRVTKNRLEAFSDGVLADSLATRTTAATAVTQQARTGRAPLAWLAIELGLVASARTRT